MPARLFVTVAQDLRAGRNLTIEFSDECVEDLAARVFSTNTGGDGLLLHEYNSQCADQHADEYHRDCGINERSSPPLPFGMRRHRLFQRGTVRTG